MTIGPSPTQRALDPATVAELVATAFGPRRRLVDCGPLTGGGFAAVWWVRLDDGRTVVLKVAPPAGARLLGYERDLLAAEARYYRLVAERAPEVPVPRVLHVGGPGVLDGGWMVMTMLPGRSLVDLVGVDDAAVRRDLGSALAALHAVTGDRFGYDGGRVSAPGWRAAFTAMVDELLADAGAWGVELPVAPERIRRVVERGGEALDLVTAPALLHWDLWDGNVLTAPGADGRPRLTGLVDGERWLWGDPLMDLVSPLIGRRIEDEPHHPLLAGYADRAGAPLVLDAPARRRLALYRLHLYLLTVVEMPSRAMTAASQPHRSARLGALVDELSAGQ